MIATICIFLLAAFSVASAVRTGTGSGLNLQDKDLKVVILMFENRGLPHFFAHDDRLRDMPKVGEYFNVGKDGTKFFVQPNATDVCATDPDHSFEAMNWEITGTEYGAKKQNEPMSGYMKQAQAAGHKGAALHAIMDVFKPDQIPTLEAAKNEFSIFDNFFVSFPGETVINRLFFNSGQSGGQVETGAPGSGDKWVIDGYKNITESNWNFMSKTLGKDSWKTYIRDFPDLIYLNCMRTWDVVVDNLRFYDDFLKDAAAGTLPQVSYLNPQWYKGFPGKQAQDMHPAHPVSAGEKLLAETYKALRNGPDWNRTVFLVTFDENGGFGSDPAAPLYNIPNPTNQTSWDNCPSPLCGYGFNTSGPRVPHMIISPLVPKGTVVNATPSGRPGFEATSVWPFLRDTVKGWPQDNTALTARQEWADSYAGVLSLKEPRTDCPSELPVPQMTEREEKYLEESQNKNPPSDLQIQHYYITEALHGKPVEGSHKKFKTAVAMGQHVRAQIKRWIEKSHREAVLRRGHKEALRHKDWLAELDQKLL